MNSMVLKINEGKEGFFKNHKDAIQYMIQNNFENEISVYDTNSDTAYKKTNEIYSAIKEYNKGRLLDDQILPTNPHGYRAIVGCLGVMTYSIGLGTYKRNHECIALFTGWNNSVLDTSEEKACIRPGMKAMASLTMLGGLYN